MHQRPHDQGGLHPGGLPLEGVSPNITGYGQQAGGTHPTGMHSCILHLFEERKKHNSSSLFGIKVTRLVQ